MAVLAPSLKALFAEIDARWPVRYRGIDGWIGDPAHQARESDHNPDSRGIVHAIDITRWRDIQPVIVQAITRFDLPTNYVIFDRKIWSRSANFVRRAYGGTNPHTNHMHVSILYGTRWEANTFDWNIADIDKAVGTAPKPGPTGEFNEFRSLFDVVNGDMISVAAQLNTVAGAIETALR